MEEADRQILMGEYWQHLHWAMRDVQPVLTRIWSASDRQAWRR